MSVGVVKIFKQMCVFRAKGKRIEKRKLGRMTEFGGERGKEKGIQDEKK